MCENHHLLQLSVWPEYEACGRAGGAVRADTYWSHKEHMGETEIESPWHAWNQARGKNKLYLTSCVIQSQQILLSSNVDTHCNDMTKSSSEKKAQEGGEKRVGGGRRVPNPSVLWRRQTSGFDYCNRCKPEQFKRECQRIQFNPDIMFTRLCFPD